MKINKRQVDKQKELKEKDKKEDFVITVLQKAGERFFDKEKIQSLKVLQREIFKKAFPHVPQSGLDNMLGNVMSKLKDKHDEQIELLKQKKVSVPRPESSMQSEEVERQQKPKQSSIENVQKYQEPIAQQQKPRPQQMQEQENITPHQSQPKIEQQREQRDISHQQSSQLTKEREKILKSSYYELQYKFDKITHKEFKLKYISHIKDVVAHIAKNQSRTTFLTGYVLSQQESNAETIKIKVHKADSDFVLNERTVFLLVNQLKNEEQVIFWMWSFANMIVEMQGLGIYHLDLKISNTVKLGRIFRCIDYEYSFLIDDKKTMKSIIAMLSYFNAKDIHNEKDSHVFGLMEVQFDCFLKKINQNNPNQTNKEQKQKWEGIYNIFKKKRAVIAESIEKKPVNVDVSLDTYQTFKEYLKLYHKISFVYGLLDMVQAANLKLSPQKKDQILEIIYNLDTDEKGNMYNQFIKAIKENNLYLTAQQPLQLHHITQLSKIQNQKIKETAIAKLESFYDWLPQKRHQIIVPIIKESITKQGKPCRIRNTCNFFKSVDDFWNLKKPRYLHYLIHGLKSALDMLENDNIYFTHLTIQDIAKQGQFFKIRTLENALMLTQKQPKEKAQQLSRDFIQQIMKEKLSKEQEVVLSKFKQEMKWLKQDGKDYKNLIAQLQNKKWQIIFNLLKQIFEVVPEDQQAEFFIIKDKVNCSEQLIALKRAIEVYSAQDLKKDKQEFIPFKKLQKIKETYNDSKSFVKPSK